LIQGIPFTLTVYNLDLGVIMNWYRTSQDNPVDGQSSEFSDDWEYDVENNDPPIGTKQILDHYNLDYKEMTFPKHDYGQMDPIIVVNEGKKISIIEDFSSSYPQVYDADSWIWRVNDRDLPLFFPPKREEEKFWNGVGEGFEVYHGTKTDRVDSIKVTGLLRKNESRGLDNRGTHMAVFTSIEPFQTESYGDVLITIDVGAMKRDGYMPPVELEEPVIEEELRSSLAYLIGLENFYVESNDAGISPDTLIFFGDIPPKYLKFEESV